MIRARIRGVRLPAIRAATTDLGDGRELDGLRAPREWVMKRATGLCVAVATVIVLIFGYAMVTLAADDHPLSVLDEHVHLDTQLKIHEGELSFRGALYEEDVVDEWACGIGHEAGGLVHGCGDPALDVRDVTSGEFTTGYIHYPTYFLGAEGFRWVVDSLGFELHDITVYRVFSALLMTLGVIVMGVFAFVLGQRRLGLIAAVSLPVSATSITVMGGMITPNATSILAGALVGGTGLLWIRRGRGFTWLALAAVFAATTAVVNSLVLGGFLFAVLVIWIANKRGWTTAERWSPKLWQLIVLAAIVLLPVVLWGRYISATATVTNAEVYGPYQFSGWSTIGIGAVQELLALHTPWIDWSYAMPSGPEFYSRLLRSVAIGLPLWITVAVFGALLYTAIAADFQRRSAVRALSEVPRRPTGTLSIDATYLVVVGTLITLVLYPVALRVSNALNFGIDHPIASRYSMPFAALIVLLLLCVVKQRRVRLVFAALGVVGVMTAIGL